MSRTVLITGASRGLGLELARAFIEKGDTVFGVSRTQKAWAGARRKTGASDRFFLDRGDITSEVFVRQWIRRVLKKQKRIDVLINNAGYGGALACIEATKPAEFEKHFRQNLFSAFLTCREVLPAFKKRKQGVIYNISSMAGIRGVPRLAGYSAAKFGLSALTQCLVKENQEWDLRAYTVCPGGMNTDMRSSLFGDEDASRQQTPGFVAGLIMDFEDGRFPVENGSELIIRHGRVWGVRPLPAA